MRSNSDNIGQREVLIVNVDSEESAGICRMLHEADYATQILDSPAELKSRLSEKSCFAVIIDIDTVAVNNRTIRDLVSAFPAIPFLCISKERFHPNLSDSIRNHIYACLTKPIDPDELSFLLKSIRKDEPRSTID